MSRFGQVLSPVREGIVVLLIGGLLLAAIASVPVIGLLAWALFGPASPPACYQDASATAPGGRYVATAMACHTTGYIGGASTWNEVDVCATPQNSPCRIAYTANRRPIIVWPHSDSLTITVDGRGHLGVLSSLHSVLGATFTYEITGKSSEEDFRKEMDTYARHLTTQNRPELVSEWVKGYWKSFYAFQSWAQANAAHVRQ